MVFNTCHHIRKHLDQKMEFDKKNFEISLLTANTNYKDLLKQAKDFNVRNLVIYFINNIL